LRKLDDLAREYSGLLKRFEARDISATEYFSRMSDIVREYIRLLDSLESVKPLHELEVPAR